MKRAYGLAVTAGILLFLCAILAGCTGSSDNSGQPVPATTAITPSALYKAGDIIKNPATSGSTGVLIISYDAATDSYTRAYIYPNADGSWGYRLDDKTLSLGRTTLEKMYTKKVGTIAVSSVPVGTPTTRATVAPTAVTTTAGSGSTSATTATTTTTTYPPRVKSIDPDKGTAGTTVTITTLAGQYFVAGANVSLKKADTTIAATDVNVQSPSLISCKIAIPAGASGGYWDVVVTNPDKQYHQYQNGFFVVASTITSTTTTTGVPTTGLVTISQVLDTLFVTGGLQSSQVVHIMGTNLTAGSNMKLSSGSTSILSTGFSNPSATTAQGVFLLPAGTIGNFNVIVIDSSGNALATSTATIEIRNS
jgi:hypothetical protein